MSPFDLDDPDSYRDWRRRKLDYYKRLPADPVLPVGNIAQLTPAEHAALLARIRATNMVLYAAGEAVDKAAIRALGRQFGLLSLDMNLRADEDSITSLRVVAQSPGTHYIPYTNRPLNWHTDGYYNPPDEWVRGIVMHCASTSASGGDNLFLDPEIAYLLLRDENPDYIRALMHPQAMTIPANIEDGVELRPEQTGPVFSVSAAGALHMRYTARTRSIEWRADAATRAAVQRLNEILETTSPYIFTLRLSPGQGLVCNNVLHDRSAFSDAPGAGRLVYRARYSDRIAAP
jgi:alpha-ketoglutarate-dependent taurine dioxygenase